MKSSTSWFSSSRKYSAMERALKRDAHTGAGRLIHLAVNQRDFGLLDLVLVDDARVGHFMIEIVTFARALADTGENGDSRRAPSRCC